MLLLTQETKFFSPKFAERGEPGKARWSSLELILVQNAECIVFNSIKFRADIVRHPSQLQISCLPEMFMK